MSNVIVLTNERNMRRNNKTREEIADIGYLAKFKSVVKTFIADSEVIGKPEERFITNCEIIEKRFVNEIWVLSNFGGDYEDARFVGQYYADELTFDRKEFIGLSEKQASELMKQRDLEYINSEERD